MFLEFSLSCSVYIRICMLLVIVYDSQQFDYGVITVVTFGSNKKYQQHLFVTFKIKVFVAIIHVDWDSRHNLTLRNEKII